MEKAAEARVISVNGERLMPTRRLGFVHHLLKEGKAKIVRYKPFTIQLLYPSKTFVQPIEKCQDTGYQFIGSSLKSEKAEYSSKELYLLPDEKQRHEDQRRYRRERRNRKRYRKPRFNNRRASKKPGWVAPSIRHKVEQHVKDIEDDLQTAPVTDLYIEVGKFDPAMLKAVQNGDPVPEGTDYQHGPRYYEETLRQACFARDGYRCICCKKGIPEGAVLHMHHALFWKGRHGDTLEELATVCTDCHTPANHQPGGKLWGYTPDKAQNLQDATYMNAIRWMLFDYFRDKYPDLRVHFTYGVATNASRKTLGLEKSHTNDAYAMGEFHPAARAETVHLEKLRRNNRILDKFYDAKYVDLRDGKVKTGKELGSNRTNRREPRNSNKSLRPFRAQKTQKGRDNIRNCHYAIRPGDTVLYEGKRNMTKGCHCKGSRVMLDTGKSVAISKIKLQKHASGWKQSNERRTVSSHD